MREPSTAGFGSSCHPGHCDFHLVVSDAAGVRRLESAAEIARFLGPIDTASEASLMAFANGHWVLACDAPLPQRRAGGWSLTSNQMVEECPVVTADVTVGVAEDGSVTLVGTKNRKSTNACVGRRPPGLDGALASACDDDPGAFLASTAHLEAASVPAFERLAEELAQLGAPRRLSTLCRRAAADERRHARLISNLARAYGARTPAVRLAPVPPRDALALALDNAVEGCVRESFGAAVGLHQARYARDPRVRAALTSIADDEVRHAALSWEIAAWIEPRLEPADAERVGRARREAIAALREELQAAPPRPTRELLGLPSAQAALRLCATLERTLWA